VAPSLGTGSITTQFHVVFADLFNTIPFIERETEPTDHWAELCLEKSTHIMLDSPPENLNDEWLTEEELEIKRRRHTCYEIIREASDKIYVGASVTHRLGDSSSAEAPSQETHYQNSSPDSLTDTITIGDNAPRASNMCVTPTST
jgi:hypothetical protein